MRTKLSFGLVLLGLGLMASGCSTGRKAFNRGDYDKAVYQAVKRLRSDNDNTKATATLKKAYRYALSTHQRKVETLKASIDPFKWEKTLHHYQAINAMAEEILRCPACLAVVPEPARIIGELITARQNAADRRYEMARESLRNKKNREEAKQAHLHLLKANEFVPGYKDSRELMEEALFYATLRVEVTPIPAPVGALQLNQEFFNNKVMEFINSNQVNPYVRFYTPEEVVRLELDYIDHRIQMSFDQFSLGNVISHTEVIHTSKDSVLLNPGSKNETYGRVEAEFKKHEKGIVGSGLLDFRILDPGLNKVISQEKFPSEFRWVVVWATYTGDKRALTDEQEELLERQEIAIPHPQFMFEQFAAPLFDQVIAKITGFYQQV